MPEPSRIAGVMPTSAGQRRHVAQPVAEDLGVGELAAALAACDAGGVVELRDAVVEDRVGLGELVALALAW
jgi:hypothetical protein